jgi:coenzyme F420-dependent glucose-6-phosphate dehydrogenase
MLKIGYKASAEQFGPRALLDFSVMAEQMGFDSVWISDHFQPWRHSGGHAPFSMAWLGALGSLTRRITMGTSVLTPTLRYQPAVVAQAFATLGVLYPERMILGLGTGESLNEVPSGVEWPEQKERTARFKEAIALIKSLWEGDRVSFEGKYYRTRNATIYDRPAEPLPIFIAAAGPFIAKLAGSEADGLICTSGKSWALYTETLLPNVLAGLDASPRPHARHFSRMIEIKLSFDTDARRALEDTRCWGALALSPEEKMNVHDPLEMEKLADALPVERTASRWIVSADPDEVVEKIAAYVALGFDHLAFHAPGPDQPRFLRSFSELVLPRLRARFNS